MEIDHIILRLIRLPLQQYFETSFGATAEKLALLVEVRGGGESGWGECTAGRRPFYSYETVETAWQILIQSIIPEVFREAPEHPSHLQSQLDPIRGHPMAKAALEAALWDLTARQLKKPLWSILGGTRKKIACGVSIGIQPDPATLLKKIESELKAGYQKIKIKIKPGWDVEIVREVRREFAAISLMVDANSAYELGDTSHLQQLDEFGLMMIEQPLRYDDFMDHSRLQQRLKTPICLDESIRHARDTAHALDAGSCRIINIKMGRVGGQTEAIKIHDLCRDRKVPVWCGGMLETGIGRAHNIALSTLENFSIPGDVSASRRYFERDVIQPAVEVDSQGFITAPEGPGIGYQPNLEWIDINTTRTVRLDRL